MNRSLSKPPTSAAQRQYKKTLTQQRKELDKAQNRINELNILFRKLYEDNALGKLSDEQFAFLTSGYDEEKKTLTRRIAELSQEIDNATERSADVKGLSHWYADTPRLKN